MIFSAAFTGASSNNDIISQKSIFGILDLKKALHSLHVYANNGFSELQLLQTKKFFKSESDFK